MALTTPATDFSLDVLGRYTCNTLSEALASTDPAVAHPAARPFDVIVVGGGTFGPVVATHMFSVDAAHTHRILLLEAGPLTLPEHVQNLPVFGMWVPEATTIAALRETGQDTAAREEVWGLPWHSPQPSPGLAYCLGGRSLYWGGWAPFLMDEELSPSDWPTAVVDDLCGNGTGQLDRAAAQLGVDQTNDFIFGALQNALRARLYAAVTTQQIPNAVELGSLPEHPAAPAAAGSTAALAQLLGLDPQQAAGRTADDLANELKLEAPLAVQTVTRPGFFPNNKFSVLPLLIEAARTSFSESGGNNADRRLMIVPRCHITRLQRQGSRVVGVHTNQGYVPLADGGAVVIALGTIESTRLALDAFGGLPGTGPIGANLMAHLRSNLTIRIPRQALGQVTDHELMAAALFLRGKTTVDGQNRFFHLMITAAGLGPCGADAEAELFRKIPDVDMFDRFRGASDTHVVITLRGHGEMEPDNPASRVILDPELDEYQVQRAFVNLQTTDGDQIVWAAMDEFADAVALAFAAGMGFEVLDGGEFHPVPAGHPPSSVLPVERWRDGLGTTHHEGGTLPMGEDPATSVTDQNCRVHGVDNAYVAGLALFPRLGSPNPMLTGVALARRLAEHLTPTHRYQPDDGFHVLFDGVDFNGWRMVGPGRFLIVDGALQAVPGKDLGLLWCVTPTPADFALRLQYRLTTPGDNSGVLVRFPDPTICKGYTNPAWAATHFGFEAQIDDLARPDGADKHRTGAIYDVDAQQYTPVPVRPAGQWNDYEIQVSGQTYTVLLNGARVTRYDNPDPPRGTPGTPQAPSHIGVQAHSGRVSFRHIRIRPL